MSKNIIHDLERVDNTKQILVFHRNTGLPIQLSSQRSKCLLYLMQGQSTKEIAFAMGLSSRTVDYYFNILRNQLGCRSSKELICSYGNQLHYSFIN